MPGFINSHGDQIDISIDGDTIMRTNTDQVVFGEKTFMANLSGVTGYFESIVVGGAISAGGGGVGGGIHGGPIFVDDVTPQGGGNITVEATDDQNFTTDISTADDDFNVHLMLERGDSQLYRPTGVLYYQTGKAAEAPSEESPVYVDPMSLSLDSNGYSWNKTINISINETLIDDSKRVYYVFKNGDRSTELRAKLETAPEVTAAEFIDQGNGSIYPEYGGSFTDESGITHSNFTQTRVKNGDTVKVKVAADKDFVQIQLGGGLSGTINVGATTSHEFTRTISVSNTSDQDKTFTVKVKDDKGNWSDVKTSTDFTPGGQSTDTIISNNYTPSMSIGAVVYDNGVQAIPQGQGMETFYYDLSYSEPAEADVYWQFETKDLLDSSYAVINDWQGVNMMPTSDKPNSGTIQFMDGTTPILQDEANMSPFRIRLFNKVNGITGGWVDAGNVFLQQYGAVPTLTMSSKTIRSGDSNSGNTDSVTISDNATLDGYPVEDGGSIEDSSGEMAYVSMNLSSGNTYSITIYNGAAAGALNITKTYAITKKSQEVISGIPLSSGTVTVKGFTLKTITTVGSAAYDAAGIPIQGDGDTFINVVGDVNKIAAKINNTSGALTAKIGSGDEGNFSYNSLIDHVGPPPDASSSAEFALNGAKTHIFFDTQFQAQVADMGAPLIIELQEVT